MKKSLIIISLVAIGMVSYGQTGSNPDRIPNQDTKSSPMLKKSGNIKYINISIQQPGVEECLGMSALQQEQNTNWIDIFPNPNPGQFTLELTFYNRGTKLTIRLYDLAGKLVFESREIPDGNHFRKDLDVSHLHKGVYFLHVTSKEGRGVKQIIIN